jgi:hypothetical protein
MSNQNKKDGIYYEQLFIAEALKRGLDVCLTLGDNLPYDVVIMNGAKSTRVQIKGCGGSVPGDGGKPRFQYTLARGRVNKVINIEYDIFAGFTRHHSGESWYIIPRRYLKFKTVKVYPDNINSGAKYEKFKGGWHYFKNLGLKK